MKTFREVFRKITGISPLEYRNKYNKETGFDKVLGKNTLSFFLVKWTKMVGDFLSYYS